MCRKNGKFVGYRDKSSFNNGDIVVKMSEGRAGRNIILCRFGLIDYIYIRIFKGTMKSFLRIHYSSIYLLLGWLACLLSGATGTWELVVCAIFIVLNFGMESNRGVIEWRNTRFKKAFYHVDTVVTTLLSVFAVLVMINVYDTLAVERFVPTAIMVALMIICNVLHIVKKM